MRGVLSPITRPVHLLDDSIGYEYIHEEENNEHIYLVVVRIYLNSRVLGRHIEFKEGFKE